ncbi:MAG: cell division protein ZapA, partial [Alphaproteobacteria bacterium]|nr:cell division protein ZapA [Alphaproteobacteria bacterium]
MAVVSLKIGGHFYKFSCNDGQEAHMRELADGLDKKAEQLLKSIGFMQE